jgi:hypothetical protein
MGSSPSCTCETTLGQPRVSITKLPQPLPRPLSLEHKQQKKHDGQDKAGRIAESARAESSSTELYGPKSPSSRERSVGEVQLLNSLSNSKRDEEGQASQPPSSQQVEEEVKEWNSVGDLQGSKCRAALAYNRSDSLRSISDDGSPTQAAHRSDSLRSISFDGSPKRSISFDGSPKQAVLKAISTSSITSRLVDDSFEMAMHWNDTERKEPVQRNPKRRGTPAFPSDYEDQCPEIGVEAEFPSTVCLQKQKRRQRQQ